MGVINLEEFAAKAAVCGQVKRVRWANGILEIGGLSFIEMSEVLDRLGDGGVQGFSREALDRLAPPDSNELVFPVGQKATTAPARASAPEVVSPAPSPAPAPIAPPQAAAAPSAPAPEAPPAAASPAEAPPEPLPSAADDPAGLAIFMRLTKMGDLVAELQKRGFADFPAILAECERLQAMMVCPLLNRVADLKQRVTTTCAAMGVAGAV